MVSACPTKRNKSVRLPVLNFLLFLLGYSTFLHYQINLLLSTIYLKLDFCRAVQPLPLANTAWRCGGIPGSVSRQLTPNKELMYKVESGAEEYWSGWNRG